MTIVTQDYNLNNLLRIRNIFYIYFKFFSPYCGSTPKVNTFLL